MISDKDIETYNRRGYLVVPNVLSEDEVAELRQVTEEFVEKSRAVSQHTDVYDLEPGQAVWMSAQTHSAVNTGNTRVKLLVVLMVMLGVLLNFFGRRLMMLLLLLSVHVLSGVLLRSVLLML